MPNQLTTITNEQSPNLNESDPNGPPDDVGRWLIQNNEARFVASFWGRNNLDLPILDAVFRASPRQFRNYVSPFLGDGLLFWSYCLDRRWTEAILGDNSEEVISTYNTISSCPMEVLACLVSLPVPPPGRTIPFASSSAPLDEIERVARIVRIGVWLDVLQLEKKERRKNFEKQVRGAERRRVLSCSSALVGAGKVNLICGDYSDVLQSADSGDLVITRTPNTFSSPDHERLAKNYRELIGRQACCIAVIPPQHAIAELYDGFCVHEVLAPPTKAKRNSNRTTTRPPVERPLIANVVVSK